MRNNSVRFKDVIKSVRRQLSDEGSRIADVPIEIGTAVGVRGNRLTWLNLPVVGAMPVTRKKEDDE